MSDPPLPGWILTRCPACGAGPHEGCVTIVPPADPRTTPHAARLERAEQRAALRIVRPA